MTSAPPGWKLNTVTNQWEQVTPANTVTTLLNAVANTGPQASSYLGAGLSTVGAVTAINSVLPTGGAEVLQHGAEATLAGLSGNIPGAITGGVLFATGILGIIRNEQSKGQKPTEAEIHSAVISMSADQLRSLLSIAYPDTTVILHNAQTGSVDTTTNSNNVNAGIASGK